ncbi:MAG: gas vesicle protein GvpN [bacterium]|nr:gas vesicle protein GvpN [bacterium]
MEDRTILEATPMLLAKEQPNFVETPYVKDIINRALLYINAGYPVHFTGPTGTGKTSLALYVAAWLERPVILVHGDEEYSSSDLVGGEHGYRRRKVVDNFVHSVLKAEEDVAVRWIDNRLTVACKHGFTLIYDEFTRSRPEANNVLLSVLEEKILDLPIGRGEKQNFLGVHPNFSAIFTSNPEEYAGVHKAQDALMNRMIPIKLSHYDRDTEIAITKAKSGISEEDAERVVDIVRELRNDWNGHSAPTVRACIMIAKILGESGARVSAKDKYFTQPCMDVLDSELTAHGDSGVREKIMKTIKKYC